MDILDSLFGWLVRQSFKAGVKAGEGAGKLITSGVTELAKGNGQRYSPTQKAQDAEARRVAGCREVVLNFAKHMGYIAREVISRDELKQLIDGGISPQDLETEILRRIEETPGLILGIQPFINAQIEMKLPEFYRDRHMYIIGKSGYGKTNFIRSMLLQDIQQGNGIGVLAPEQELITEEILPYIPDHRIDDVVYVNPADKEHPVCFNPLRVDEGEDINEKHQDTFTILKRLMGESGARMDYILEQTLYALMERPGSTLLDIPRFLSREDISLQEEVFKTTKDEQVRAFIADYRKYPKDAHFPLTRRLSPLFRREAVKNLLCQPGHGFNFREAMDEGKILLCNLSDGILGVEASQVLGQFIVSKLQLAAMSRADTPAKFRRPFFLYLDEFQAFTGINETAYSTMLSRARKYRLSMTLANQQTWQLPPSLLHEIFGNVSTFIAFNVSHEDARKLSQEYRTENERVEPEDFLSLKVGEAFAKIGRSIFLLQTRLVSDQPDYIRATEVIKRSRMNYGLFLHKPPQPPEHPENRGLDTPPDDESPIDPAQVF